MVIVMNYCNDCKVNIKDNTLVCPLCGSGLSKKDDDFVNAYPKANVRKKSYWIIKRILLYVSILTGISCVIINFLRPEPLWWSIIAVASIVYAWVAVPHAMRRGGNYAGKIFTQVTCGIFLVVVIDISIGWSAWSVNYAAPIMLCVGIIAVGLVVLCNATNWARYAMYQALLAIFGFVPILLYIFGFSTHWFFAIITSALALATLIALAVFGDRSIKNEFRRRLRF